MSIKTSFDLKIGSLEFIVTPIQISIEGEGGHNCFVEFNKGAQILKKFDEQIVTTSSKSLYLFKKGQFARFKLSFERGCSCQWGVYRIIARDSYQFIDSLPINLLEYYNNFVNSLRPIQKDYNKILAEKGQGKQVSKAWSALKSAALWEYSSIFAKNRSNSIQICFRLQIRCELDNNSQLQKPLQRLKSQKSLLQINNAQKEANQMQQSESNITIQVSTPRYPKQEEQSKLELPPPRIGMDFTFKRDSVLSQIPQRSNENQSNVNYGDKKQQLQQISGIPEEDSEMFSPSITNTKTMNFQGFVMTKGGEDFIKRRCNTYDSNFNEGNNSLSQKWIKQVEHQVNQDEELGKEQLRAIMETSPQSRVATEKPKEEKKALPASKIKWIIAVILILLISGGYFYYSKFSNNKKQLKPKASQHSNKPKPKQKKDSQIKKNKGNK